MMVLTNLQNFNLNIYYICPVDMEEQNMKRFKVIKHRNGTRTLIDNQIGMKFFRANDEAVEDAIRILKSDRPTNKYYED